MAKESCECGAPNHMSQIEQYPVGTKVILNQFGEAVVTHHCDDGRAVFETSTGGHTFHFPVGWIKKTIAPEVDELAQANATIERLRAALAQTWQPINNSKVPCTQFATGGANQHGDYLVVWSDELNEGTVHLPDDVRLCRKVTP